MTKEEAIAVFECLATEMTAILAGIPKSEAATGQIKRYIDAYDIAISALRIQQKQESECANCSGIVYRQTDSGKIIPVDQRCGVKITPPCYVPDVPIKSMETTTTSQSPAVSLARCARATRSGINKSLYTMILWCLMSYDRCAVNLYGVKS